MIRTSDLSWQLELDSKRESDDAREDLEWGRKWLANYNAEKTRLVSSDQSNNSSAIDVKMDGSFLEKKSYFKMLEMSVSFKLDWGLLGQDKMTVGLAAVHASIFNTLLQAFF